MKTWKKIAISAGTTALVLSSCVSVFAVAETSNEDITDHSQARSVARDNDDMRATNVSDGIRFANVDVGVANTGFNSQNRNEDENLTESSGADAYWETANFANVNETEFGESSGATASNDTVDDHSGDVAGGAPGGPVTAIADDSDVYRVNNTNTRTRLFNVTASVANTGLNDQNGNEDLNNMTAGTAMSTSYAGNVVNDNYTMIGSGDSETADAYNESITDHSQTRAEAYDNDNVGVNNTNAGTSLVNVTASVANSGLNNQNGNEDENTMETGATDAYVETANFVNVNETVVDTGSSAEASNENVDDHSEAVAIAEDNDTVRVSNTNTRTRVLNVSVSVANSGGNDQNGNEDGNSMKTGTAVVTGKTANVVNANQTYVGVTPEPAE